MINSLVYICFFLLIHKIVTNYKIHDKVLLHYHLTLSSIKWCMSSSRPIMVHSLSFLSNIISL